MRPALTAAALAASLITAATAQANQQSPAPADVPPAPVTAELAAPEVSGSHRALRVVFTNTTGQPIEVAFTASDGGHPYHAVRRRIAAGERVAVVLVATSELREIVARRARRAKIVRRPTVRVVDLFTGESAIAVPRIVVAG
jgi:hypothetical protein